MPGSKNNQSIAVFFIAILCGLIYGFIAFELQRKEFVILLMLSVFLFGFYFLGVFSEWKSISVRQGILIGLFFRLLFLFATPQLSDDYFRFVWDGRLIVAGENPYLSLPKTEIDAIDASAKGLTLELYNGLNSKEYYSVYPPVHQAFFAVSTFFSGGDLQLNIFLLRIVILIGECLLLALLFRFAEALQVFPKTALHYWLNPLVVIELAGNLHFEGWMMLFLLLCFWMLYLKRTATSAVFFALAVGVKLLPLLFFPFLWKRIERGKRLVYTVIVFTVGMVLFFPYLDLMSLPNMFESVGLYFRKFEFNASIYYLVRWLGELIAGYNIIAYAGPALSFCVLAMAAFLFIKQKREEAMGLFLLRCMLLLTFYFLCATTVHPWYLVSVVALGVFSVFRFSLVWSFLVILSYATYASDPYSENLMLTTLAYALLALFVVFEFFIQKRSGRIEQRF